MSCGVVYELPLPLLWWDLLASVFTMAAREYTWSLCSLVVASCLCVTAM